MWEFDAVDDLVFREVHLEGRRRTAASCARTASLRRIGCRTSGRCAVATRCAIASPGAAALTEVATASLTALSLYALTLASAEPAALAAGAPRHHQRHVCGHFEEHTRGHAVRVLHFEDVSVAFGRLGRADPRDRRVRRQQDRKQQPRNFGPPVAQLQFLYALGIDALSAASLTVVAAKDGTEIATAAAAESTATIASATKISAAAAEAASSEISAFFPAVVAVQHFHAFDAGAA